jgi:hypothetical protein
LSPMYAPIGGLRQRSDDRRSCRKQQEHEPRHS